MNRKCAFTPIFLGNEILRGSVKCLRPMAVMLCLRTLDLRHAAGPRKMWVYDGAVFTPARICKGIPARQYYGHPANHAAITAPYSSTTNCTQFFGSACVVNVINDHCGSGSWIRIGHRALNINFQFNEFMLLLFTGKILKLLH